MLAALDLYLATASASATQMVTYASLGIVGLGGFFWGCGHVGDQLLSARRASQGIK
ncbi:hypothetical protein [uncultured Variovorax sp.]|uniref:hypothetical protein n=1 Tax=uncultured Variovorax sp. TaxID=114708 RepID=UPI0026028FCE|nr:hypothetical protein [uncultured Variovorax sp.]